MATGLVLCTGSAAAVSSGPRADGLSPRLAELAKPALRSASPPQQAAALGLAAEGPGSLVREGRRVLVEVRFDRGAAAGLDDLRAAGAKVVDVSRRYQSVSVAVKPAQLHGVAAVSRVGSVSPVLAPILRAASCGGAVASEGDAQLTAASARAAFGVDGGGVKVGILSDSFDRDSGAVTHAAGDVANGDLPGPGSPCGSNVPVGSLDDSDSQGSDEGRAMAQTIHDLAPGASLAFATGFTPSLFGFADNIRRLVNAGAQVLVDDVIFLEEPFFQDGPVAVAATEAVGTGAAYFSAAGNDNLIDAEGNDIASWEAPEFRSSGACPAALEAATTPKAEDCMDFDPGAESDDTFGLTVSNGATLTVDLQWAEPWFGVETDLDAFLLDSVGNPVEVKGEAVSASEDNVTGTEEPVEVLQWENKTGSSQQVQLAINRCSATCNPNASTTGTPRLKFVLVQNGSGVTASEYPESSGGDVVGPTVFGHSGAAAAVAVGAVPYNNSSEPEPYSSRGPVTQYFGPVQGKFAAQEIDPVTIGKPDLVATDCGRTTFFLPTKTFGVFRFCGTSASAPHAAAVAALMKQANPSLSVTQLRTALAATANPVGSFGPDAVGGGLVNAYDAVKSVALPPAIAITERPPALGNVRRPAIGFTANRPVTFACSLDGGGLQPCSSPFVPPAPLADGVHGFVVQGVDVAGRVGKSELVAFKIDGKRPSTFFRKRPHKTILTRHRRAKAVFRFGSNERGVTFVCKVDAGLLRFCRPRLVKRFRVGKHVVWVKARDAAGNVDRSPAVYRFKVKRVGR